MFRFIASFSATLVVAILTAALLFPPVQSSVLEPSKTSKDTQISSQQKGKLTTIEMTENFRLRARSHEYKPAENISQRHSFIAPNAPNATRVWHGLAPGGFGPFPALILLHGSNRTGNSMIDMWRVTAHKQGIILIAPDARVSQGWTLKDDGPEFLNALIKDAQDKHRIDPDQIYVMGHSAGGLFVQRLAGINDPIWKAMASHGAATRQKKLIRSNKPVPLYLYTGSKDHLFPPDKMERAAEMLSAAGHDVTRFDIPAHTHWYYEIGPQLAPIIWKHLTGSKS